MNFLLRHTLPRKHGDVEIQTDLATTTEAETQTELLGTVPKKGPTHGVEIQTDLGITTEAETQTELLGTVPEQDLTNNAPVHAGPRAQDPDTAATVEQGVPFGARRSVNRRKI